MPSDAEIVAVIRQVAKWTKTTPEACVANPANVHRIAIQLDAPVAELRERIIAAAYSATPPAQSMADSQ